jgi:predicted amidohydrolase YtcJ
MNTSQTELILTGGMFPTIPEADSLVIGRGKILAVGRMESVKLRTNECAKTIDLEGKAVLPGFIDAHTHLLSLGLKEIEWEVDFSQKSRDELLEYMAYQASQREPDEWIIGRGWDETHWKDRSYLTRGELDQVVPQNPLFAVRIDGHLLTANSLALKRLPVEPDPKLIDRAKGFIREEAAFSLLRSIEPDEETFRKGLRAATTLAHRLGVTSVHTMSAAERVHLYLKEWQRNKLRVTLYPKIPCIDALKTLGIQSPCGDEWLRIGGVKVFADGSIGAANAAVGTPYADAGGTGALNYANEALLDVVREAEEANLQTVIHAIGDRGIEQVLKTHSSLNTSKALRHRIEHFELPTLSQIERAGKLGLNLSMQPNFVGNWSGEGSLYEKRLGKERDQQSNPHRLILDAGVPLAFGSDCMPFSPLYGLHCAVNAPYAPQRVSVEEAITCYTTMGAHFSFEEEIKGKLAPGMLADLVILSEDPRQALERIADLEVEMTILGGEIVYQR